MGSIPLTKCNRTDSENNATKKDSFTEVFNFVSSSAYLVAFALLNSGLWSDSLVFKHPRCYRWKTVAVVKLYEETSE
ncbi:unnamed protein product [Heterobilharzia americana]|nr:unnamed protein product [Heterobilharzia americana]